VAWQGWVVLAVYFALLLLGSSLLVFREAIVPYLIFTFGLTAVLLRICWVKGERPRWRWGGDESPPEPAESSELAEPVPPVEPD